MTQVIGTHRESKCMYCGAGGYGIGCPYSPHKKHVHCDDPKRCIYCGSTTFGQGCPYNPFGRMHVHGVEFNQMMKESLHKSYTAGLFLARVTQPIIEHSAFKQGLVDESGKRLRDPQTVEEQNAFTPLDAYIFRLRRLIGEDKLQLMGEGIMVDLMSKEPSSEKFDVALYEKEVKLKSRIAHLVKDYKNIIIDGNQDGISLEAVENMIIECFLNKSNEENS